MMLWKWRWPTSGPWLQPRRKNQIPATLQAERMPEPIDHWRIICFDECDQDR